MPPAYTTDGLRVWVGGSTAAYNATPHMAGSVTWGDGVSVQSTPLIDVDGIDKALTSLSYSISAAAQLVDTDLDIVTSGLTEARIAAFHLESGDGVSMRYVVSGLDETANPSAYVAAGVTYQQAHCPTFSTEVVEIEADGTTAVTVAIGDVVTAVIDNTGTAGTKTITLGTAVTTLTGDSAIAVFSPASAAQTSVATTTGMTGWLLVGREGVYA